MNLESELRTTLRDRAEHIPDLPAPYAELHRRLRRSNRMRVAGAAVAAFAMAGAGAFAYHVNSRPTVGTASRGSWPLRGNEAGDPNAVRQAEAAAEHAVHGRPGSMVPLFVGTLNGSHVVVAVAAHDEPGGDPARVVLVDGIQSTNLVAIPNDGSTAWVLAEVQFPHGDPIELFLPGSPGVTMRYSKTVTWDATGTPRRSWSAVPTTNGYSALAVPAGQEALWRFRLYATGVLVRDDSLGDGKEPSLAEPPGSLLDSMQNAYGHPVNKAAVAKALTQAAPIAGNSDYASWQPKIIWTGTSNAYGPDSVLVQVRIRGSVLQGMAGDADHLQPGCFEPVPAGWADRPYYFTAAPLPSDGGTFKAEVWVAGGVTAQTVQTGKTVGSTTLDTVGNGLLGAGDQRQPDPIDLTVRDAHGNVILHRTDINVQDGQWDLPIPDLN